MVCVGTGKPQLTSPLSSVCLSRQSFQNSFHRSKPLHFFMEPHQRTRCMLDFIPLLGRVVRACYPTTLLEKKRCMSDSVGIWQRWHLLKKKKKVTAHSAV